LDLCHFSFVFFFLGLFMGSLFVFIYDKAFAIPEGIADLTRDMRLANLLLADPWKREENQRAFASIPCVGIDIGSFKKMERTATPDFIDFSISKIVDLLITF